MPDDIGASKVPEPQKPPLPPSIAAVLDEELQQIKTSRKLRLDPGPQRPAAQKSLIGLAFSGGGIRSATFNLGVLQALAKRNLLRSIDYVSTVSGGGYIGGWLMGWMHHQELGIRDIESRLSTPPSMPGRPATCPKSTSSAITATISLRAKACLAATSWRFSPAICAIPS